MNILLRNLFNADVLQGYTGSLLMILSVFGNFQIAVAVFGGVLGIAVSVMAFLKSIKEYNKAKFE